jgi:hypothetical protein
MIWETYEAYSAAGRFFPKRYRSHTGGWILKIKKRRRDSKYQLTVRKQGHTYFVHRSSWGDLNTAKVKADKLIT